jgi:hypothetical protein
MIRNIIGDQVGRLVPVITCRWLDFSPTYAEFLFLSRGADKAAPKALCHTT